MVLLVLLLRTKCSIYYILFLIGFLKRVGLEHIDFTLHIFMCLCAITYPQKMIEKLRLLRRRSANQIHLFKNIWLFGMVDLLILGNKNRDIKALEPCQIL